MRRPFRLSRPKQTAPLSAFRSPATHRRDLFVLTHHLVRKVCNFSGSCFTGHRSMGVYNLLLLPGDRIGPERMAEVSRVVRWVNSSGLATINSETDLVGGCAYDAHGDAISEATMQK